MAIREHSIYDCILRNALNLSGETALVSGDLRLTYFGNSNSRQLSGTWITEYRF